MPILLEMVKHQPKLENIKKICSDFNLRVITKSDFTIKKERKAKLEKLK